MSTNKQRIALLNKLDYLKATHCQPCHIRPSGRGDYKKQYAVCKACSALKEIESVGKELIGLTHEKRNEKAKREEVEKKQARADEAQRRKREMAFSMDVKEFVNLKYEPLETGKCRSMEDIAGMKGVSPATLYAWKKENDPAIQTVMAAEGIEDPRRKNSSKPNKQRTEQPVKSVAEKDSVFGQIKELKEERNNAIEERDRLKKTLKAAQKEIELLKREVIDAHKLVTTLEEELEVETKINDKLHESNISLRKEKSLHEDQYQSLYESYNSEQEAVCLLQEKLYEVENEMVHAKALLQIYLAKSTGAA